MNFIVFSYLQGSTELLSWNINIKTYSNLLKKNYLQDLYLTITGAASKLLWFSERFESYLKKNFNSTIDNSFFFHKIEKLQYETLVKIKTRIY